MLGRKPNNLYYLPPHDTIPGPASRLQICIDRKAIRTAEVGRTQGGFYSRQHSVTTVWFCSVASILYFSNINGITKSAGDGTVCISKLPDGTSLLDPGGEYVHGKALGETIAQLK